MEHMALINLITAPARSSDGGPIPPWFIVFFIIAGIVSPSVSTAGTRSDVGASIASVSTPPQAAA